MPRLAGLDAPAVLHHIFLCHRFQLSTINPMKRIIELLAPGGDIDSIKAAIVAGADAKKDIGVKSSFLTDLGRV